MNKEKISESVRYLRIGSGLIFLSILILILGMLFRNPTILILSFVTAVYAEVLGFGIMIIGGIKTIAEKLNKQLGY